MLRGIRQWRERVARPWVTGVVVVSAMSGLAGAQVADGTYLIKVRHSDKALDLNGGIQTNGNQLQQWTADANNANQRWRLTRQADGSYEIGLASNPAKVMDANASGTANSTIVQVWDDNNSNAQRWVLTATDSGFYKVANRNAATALASVSGASTADGAKIVLWNETTASTNAQWSFTSLTGTPPPPPSNTEATTGGTATTSSTGSPAGEGVAQVFDDNANTKWLTFGTSGWVQYQFGGTTTWAINRYTLTSANDVPERDPRSWTLQASNDGTTWTNLNSQANQAFTARFQVKEYTFANSTQYRYYRLNITANNGSGGETQLAELQLFGTQGTGNPPPPPPPPPTGSGDGLNARYYNNMTVSGTAALTRTDSTVNFAWAGSPGTGVNTDGFSVRWMGEVNPPTTGAYTFQVVGDDGIRLWVNDASLIDQWRDQGPTTYTSGVVNLTANTRVDINVDFYENTGGSEARLRWKKPGDAGFVTIPQANLYSTGGDTPPTVTPPPPPPPPNNSRVVNRVRFYPRSDLPGRMVGGRFQGSNTNATSGFVDLYTINSTPNVAWNDVNLSNSTEYRYLRYYSPAGSYGNVAEVEFYSGTVKLSGTNYGTSGSLNNSGNDYTKAFDGNTGTYFDAPVSDDQYVGVDQGGTTPPPPPPPNALRLYMIGNSMTDQVWYESFLPMANAAGKSVTLGSHRIPGAPLDWIWSHPGDGFNHEPYPRPRQGGFTNYTWDAVTLQPFDRSIGMTYRDTDLSDGGSDNRTSIKAFVDLARQRPENANIQFYTWQQNGGVEPTENFMTKWDATYSESQWGSSGNPSRDFNRKLVEYLRQDMPYLSKPFRTIPNGDALYEIDKRARAGQIPGFSTINALFPPGDTIHLNNVGAFIYGTTAYATIWKTSPVGMSYASYDRTPSSGSSNMDITDSMARAIQEAVWFVVSNHDYAGVKAGS